MKNILRKIRSTSLLCLMVGTGVGCQLIHDSEPPKQNPVKVYFRSDFGEDDGSYVWFNGRYDGPLHYLGSLTDADMAMLASAPKGKEEELPDMDVYVHLEFTRDSRIYEGLFCLTEELHCIYTEPTGWVCCPTVWDKIYAFMKSEYAADQR